MLTTKHLREDSLAGTVVFLVALPLCLGIALASGVPLSAGLLAGIIGGTVIAALGGSELSVSGPAAGLTIIVLNAMGTLGTFETFLLAVLISGVLQVILGFVKAGVMTGFVPHSVIKGMLAAIGIILILKQIPHAVGWDQDAEGEMEFFQADGENTFSEIIRAFGGIHIGAAIIAAVSLAVLILWPMVAKPGKGKAQSSTQKVLALIPASLLAVIAGTVLNLIFESAGSSLAVSAIHKVQIPVASSLEEMKTFFHFPNWSAISNPDVWIVAGTLAAVASIESLLSVEAVDRLDPLRRTSNVNRELIAQGVGNSVAGLIGGMPVTAVIVRSATNVSSGGRTRMASLIHGLWLIVALTLVPTLLNTIPLACLAAVLLVVGYKLTQISLFTKTYAKGMRVFAPFISTVLATVFVDLLVGIGVGICVGIIVILVDNIKHSHTFEKTENDAEHRITFRLSEDVTFLNKPALSAALNKVPPGSFVTIDGTQTKHLDPDVHEMLTDFAAAGHYKNIQVELKLLEE